MAVKPFDFTKSATKKTTGATSGRTSQIPTLSVLAGGGAAALIFFCYL